MNKIKNVYISIKSRIYRRFAKRCRKEAEVIYYDKFDIVMVYDSPYNYDQRQLMWRESMDTVLNRSVNKLILKIFKVIDKIDNL